MLTKVTFKVTTASCSEFIKPLRGSVSQCACECACECERACAATDRLVFDGGAGHAEVQLAVLFDAGIDQSLHGALVLEQQEGVSCRNTAPLLMRLRASEEGARWNSVQPTLELQV